MTLLSQIKRSVRINDTFRFGIRFELIQCITVDVSQVDDMDEQGIIGLGPSSSSGVRKLVNSSAGNPFLDRIFRQNMSTPNFITTLLSRETDLLPGGSDPVVGQLTIGSIVSDFSSITDQPKLPALTDQFGVQHWQSLLDENGIIGPDGERIETKTSIDNPDQGSANQMHVIFDTGFTFPQVLYPPIWLS